MIGVYLYTNKINSKQYVGQSVDIDARYKRHISRSKNNKSKIAIDNAIKKYGIDNFDFDVLVECPIEDLNIQEEYWIKYWNTFKGDGYNMTIGGDSFTIGEDNLQYKHTKYNFEHLDGRTEYCTQYELYKKYDLDVSAVSRICLKKGRTKSIKGWGLAGWVKNLKRDIHTIYNFINEDGTEITCTKNQLAKKYNLYNSYVSRLCLGKVEKINGWYLNKNKEVRHEGI